VEKSPLIADLEYTSFGTVAVDPMTFQTNIAGVFAGGDVISGPDDVISAIEAGKEAAFSIDRYLCGIDPKEGRPQRPARVKNVPKDNVVKKARQVMPVLDLDKREGFSEVETGFSEEMAVQSSKCLNCAVCSECRVSQGLGEAINHDMKDEIVEVDVSGIACGSYQP
jgi:heterodisulfide reductase subunit A-like polyferredoxin